MLLVVQALLRHGELQAGVGELTVGVGGLAGGLLLVGRGLGEGVCQLGRAVGSLTGGLLVLVDRAAGLGGLGSGLLALSRDLVLLAQGIRELVLKTALVRRGGLELGGKPCLLALGLCRGGARVGKGRLGLLGVLQGFGQGGTQGLHALLERADAPLALKGAALVGCVVANMHAAVGQDRHAVGGDEGHGRPRLVGRDGLARARDQANVAEKGLEKPARLVAGAKLRGQSHAGRPLGGRGDTLGRAHHDGGLAFRVCQPQRALRHLGGRGGVCHHEGGKVVSQ